MSGGEQNEQQQKAQRAAGGGTPGGDGKRNQIFEAFHITSLIRDTRAWHIDCWNHPEDQLILRPATRQINKKPPQRAVKGGKMSTTLFFAILALVCAVGWLTRYVSGAALLWYIDKKGIPLPSDAEMAEGCKWAVQNMIKDLFGRRSMH